MATPTAYARTMFEYTSGQLRDVASSPSLETLPVTPPAHPSPPVALHASIFAGRSAALFSMPSPGVSAEPSPTLS
ncbi:hypothetical protein GGP41_007845 [Bipolaris sorokiniana]|uniref:Uncharacterized protein n=1 Tax=Cochliobolus sativus TaxID=45130 RepID=A0A8H5ZP08_COCSA|nr:hypothetical protein GGP41_007845 [Bipolaris sorokiniana]